MLRSPLLPVALCLTPLLAAQDGGVYQAIDDIVVIEMESTPTVPDWSDVTDASNYLFRSFYRWDGPDHFGSPGHGIRGYRFRVSKQGNYRLSLRNRHDHPDSTLENDVWARMDGGGWIKVYSGAPVGVWHWSTRFDPGHAHANWDLDAGEHLIEYSGRSNNFMMDRFHIYLTGHPDEENENLPESPALLGSRYCDPAVNNSTGQPAEIAAVGSTFPENDDLRLVATNVARDEFGYLLASQTRALVKNPGGSDGNLCLGGSIVRFQDQLQDSGPNGVISTSVDVPALGVLAGETWSFQVWFRDTTSSNFSDGVSVVFQ